MLRVVVPSATGAGLLTALHRIAVVDQRLREGAQVVHLRGAAAGTI
jgi:hypothetical protein